MIGYKITYMELDGSINDTFFGGDDINFLLYMFRNAHPGCVPIDYIKMTLTQYKKECNLC